MRRQSETLDNHDKQLTPNEVMRMQNCKSFAYSKNEMYPSIRPPISRCYPEDSDWFLLKAVEESGCNAFPDYLVPTVADETQAAKDKPEDAQTGAIDNPCTSRKYVVSKEDLPQRELDYSKLSPSDVMRMINCDTVNFQKFERYPSIRPPISQCSAAQTALWMAQAMADSGCGRHFDMAKDDVIEVWKRSPDKDTLVYYGIGSGIHEPQAVVFNQLVSKCLEKVSQKKIDEPKPPTPQAVEMRPQDPPADSVLNREALQAKVSRMPTVQEALDASKALTWLHCPRFFEDKYPFLKRVPTVSPAAVIGKKRPPAKPKRGLRRKHKYCNLPCSIPGNEWTDLDTLKDPKRYETLYKEEMEELEREFRGLDVRNYDQLQSEWVARKHEQYSQGALHLHPGRDRKNLDDQETTLHTGRRTNALNAQGPQTDKHVHLGRISKKSHSKEPRNYEELYTELVTTFEKIPKSKSVKRKTLKSGGAGGDAGGDARKSILITKPPHEETDQSDVDILPPKSKRKKKESKKKKTSKKMPITPTEEVKQNPRFPMRFSSDTDLTIPDGLKPTHSADLSRDLDKEVKKTKRRKKVRKPIKVPEDTEPTPECPCEICKFMHRRELEPDTPLINQIRKDNKRLELLNYYKGMCRRNRIQCENLKWPAVQRKCDPIECSDFFCEHPKFGEYCDYISAIDEVQKLLGSRHCIADKQILHNMTHLKNRLCERIYEHF